MVREGTFSTNSISMSFRRLCVYCGSKTGTRPSYSQAAQELGKLLANLGWGLVYGGGSIGLMGILADSVLEHDGEAIGVITKELFEHEVGHDGLTEMHIVDTMHERKKLMFDLVDGFVVLPGGFGTLDEFFEIITWQQLGIHSRPVGLLNVDGYFDRLLAFLDHTRDEEFINEECRRLIVDGDTPAGLLLHMLKALPQER